MSRLPGFPGRRRGGKVIRIITEARPEMKQKMDAWPPIKEFMHDFSASHFALTELIGKKPGYEWPIGETFKFLLVAES
jgi:hypothetical protein